MSLGQCLISNEPDGIKEKIITMRVNKKSWAQIADELGYSSPQAARNDFAKRLGVTKQQAKDINLFKVKGADLDDLLKNETVDALKTTVPKKGTGKAPSGPANKQAAEEAADAVESAFDDYYGAAKTKAPHPLGDDIGEIVEQAFPHNKEKVLLNGQTEANKFNQYFGSKQTAQIDKWAKEVREEYGDELVKAIAQDLDNGAYYGALNKKYNVPFAQIDRINLHRLLSQSGQPPRKAIWDIYKKKPTSEDAFKMVQDQVWSMKRMGADAKVIAKASDIPENVVDLILEGKWKLPEKGSNWYVGYNSTGSTSTSGTGFGTSAPKPKPKPGNKALRGERNQFENFEFSDSDAWSKSLGRDLDQESLKGFVRYTGNDFTVINSELRGINPLSERTRKTAEAMSRGMRGFPEDATLYRATDYKSTFANIPKDKDGLPIIGEAFKDNAFMSTSYGGRPGMGGNRDALVVIDAPKGLPARPVHEVSQFGAGEREVVIERETEWVITGAAIETINGAQKKVIYLSYVGKLIP